MTAALSIRDLEKTYASGLTALAQINLDVHRGEIFALLGPNGAGKTTLISAICGILKITGGSINVMGYDHQAQFRAAREQIGLVPQELTTDAFETVWNTVSFSRGLFGKSKNPAYIETLLKDLSLWDKKDSQIRTLSGGMKRRVMIAKALSHEPTILFLDEPTAGVDVSLRKSMWQQVRKLQQSGVTIILTTHYLEEAEEMADRIGIINNGKLVMVEDKKTLMKKMGFKELVVELMDAMTDIPAFLSDFNVHLAENGGQIVYPYDPVKENDNVVVILERLRDYRIKIKDFSTRQSSLEDIFVNLVGEK